MNSIQRIGVYVAIILIAGLIVGAPLVLPVSGPRDVSSLETIHGISYPIDDNGTHVLEKLAHADIYLKESVFAKQLRLRFEFNPGNTSRIDVGVRENSFWLSYPKYEVWNGAGEKGWQTREITIPLTDKLQEPNRSIDLMFFSQTPTSTGDVEEGLTDSVDWQIRGIQANVEPATPTIVAIKDFIRAQISREKAL